MTRTCKTCGTGLENTPYECWLFHQCEYCTIELAREYDTTHVLT